MQGPKNVRGVVGGVVITIVVVWVCLALGLDETTRKGVPVWLLALVGVGAGLGFTVESWIKHPHEVAGTSPGSAEGPRFTRGAKVVLTGFALWWFVPIVAILVGALVGLLR